MGTIRYYERVGAISPVHLFIVNNSGYRDYNTNDLNLFYLAKKYAMQHYQLKL